LKSKRINGDQNMEKIITFIIPAYNSEIYLEKCLNSFLTDEATREFIEVIVVNDGSTDRTASIAQQYISEYPSIFRLINKENGGHGSGINVGSLEAHGKYMKVIDADDWVETENLPEWVSILKTCQADVVLTPFHQVNMQDGSRSEWKMYGSSYKTALTFDDIMNDWKSYDVCFSLHGITYRTEFYNHYRNELPEKVFYEDQEYSMIPCCQAKSIYAIDLYIYEYLVGNSAQSMADENRVKRISHVEKVTEEILKFWKVHPELSPSAKEFLLKKISEFVLSYYVVACLIQKDKKEGRTWARRYNDMIKNYEPDILKRVRKKYYLYLLMSYLGLGREKYEKLLNSRLCCFLRGSHRIESGS